MFEELADYRQAARRAVTELGHEPVCLEDVAMPLSPGPGSIHHVKMCQVMILLLGYFYGTYEEPDGKSFTEMEYDAALEATPKPVQILAFATDPKKWGISQPIFEKHKNNGTAEAQATRAAEFRKRVGERMTPKPFVTADELKTAIKKSLLMLGLGGAKARSRRARPPGEMLPRLCDREPQRIEFKQHFKLEDKPANAPVLYVLAGTEDQSHESCIRALVWRELQQERQELELEVEQPEDFVVWPQAGSAAHRSAHLIHSLHEVLDRDYNTASDVATFVALAASTQRRYLVLRHLIPDFDEPSQRLFEQYLGFWQHVAEEWTKDSTRPLMIVFFELQCRRVAGQDAIAIAASLEATATALLGSHTSPAGAVRFRSKVLPPLGDVSRGDFKIWAEKYGAYLPVTIRTLDFNAVFKSEAVPMRTFEDDINRRLGEPEEDFRDAGRVQGSGDSAAN